MVGRIAVPPELAAASPKIRGDAALFADILNKLRVKVAELEFSWKGAAHDNYALYTNEWDMASQALFGSPAGEGLLDQIADVMRVVWDNYVLVEDTNTAGWRHG
jgi:uncharacterized protein YukE